MPQEGFSVFRYNANGTRNVTCGNGGVITAFPENAFVRARAMAVQVNGDVVAGGRTSADPSFGPIQGQLCFGALLVNRSIGHTFGTIVLVIRSRG